MTPSYKTVSIRIGSETETKKGLLGSKEIALSGYASLSGLSSKIESECNSLASAGYEVISILPVLRGSWGSFGNMQGGYGFSVTDGVVITARKA